MRFPVVRFRMPRHSVRDQVLAAGLEVFRTHGYHASSVQDITTAAGVPKGSFYNHFAGKEALAVASIYEYAAESPIAILLDTSAGTPVERLRAHFDIQGARFTASKFSRGCLMGNFANEVADHSDTIRETLTGAFDGWSALIEAVLVQAQQAGDISAQSNPADLANFVVNSWEGALTRARVSKTEEPLRVFFDTIFGVVLR